VNFQISCALKKKGTSEAARELKEILQILWTVLALSFYMTHFSTTVAPIPPVTSFAITNPVPIHPTVIAAARRRSSAILTDTSYTTRDLGKSANMSIGLGKRIKKRAVKYK
jgi:hypothetical protein